MTKLIQWISNKFKKQATIEQRLEALDETLKRLEGLAIKYKRDSNKWKEKHSERIARIEVYVERGEK